nr:hypothetical protein [Tanacetum cinerariifolium]
EPASLVRDVSEGESCPTDSGFIADQDRATIAKSSTLPHDSAPRVTSPAADEGSMQQNISELTALCTSLQRQYSELMSKFQAQEEEIGRLKERVQVLENREGVTFKQSREDAPIKGRSNNEGEAAAERISNDSEEIARVLTSMDVATVLAGKLMFPLAVVSFPLLVARELEEQQEKEDMRMNEQITRDAEVVRIHAEEEIQGMIDSLDKSNETLAKYLQEYQQFASELPLEKKIELINDLRFKDFKGMTFEEIEAKFGEVWKQIENFVPMGSKEETERLKRRGLNLEKEQNYMHAPVEWKLYDLSGVHHVTAKYKEIFMLVEKDYPLRRGLTLVMISYRLQVENYSQMAEDFLRKIYNIANTPRKQSD